MRFQRLCSVAGSVKRMVDATQKRPGRVLEITSLANPVVKSLKALAQKKNRDADGLFMAEGLKHAMDGLERGWQMRQRIYAKSMANHQLAAATAAQARAKGTDVLEVSEKVLSSITRRDIPQMVVSVFEQQWADA